MMGGLLGLVGLGRMICSLNTARLPRSRGGRHSPSSFSFVARMLDCDTPVLGARAIRLAAAGVAVCSTGLLISGRAEPDLLAATGDSTSPSALSGEAIGAGLGSVGETGLAGVEENVGLAVELTPS